ncbi:hypothetical protein [Alkalihalobacterium bogoriense]|uniref:hypothetical protein n=1 Tax=Alkalihalobacterium bogoriense TaxID=246272 RepID=UPI00047DCAF0|nr:hypothetical protein [Alkalihalobacterium bogoriense]
MKHLNEDVLNKLKSHPYFEPRQEAKKELKQLLRQKAVRVERTHSILRVVKFAPFLIVAIISTIWVTSFSGVDTIKNGFQSFFGISPITDEREENDSKEVQPIRSFAQLQATLLAKGMPKLAVSSLTSYFQAIEQQDVKEVEQYSVKNVNYSEIIQFYNEIVSVPSFVVTEVEHNENEIIVQLAYQSKKDNNYQLVTYSITKKEQSFFIQDNILTQNPMPDYEFSPLIIETYTTYKKTGLNSILSSLSKTEFVELYYYTEQQHDYDMLYDLHTQHESSLLYKSKKHYVDEMRRTSNKSSDSLLAIYEDNEKNDHPIVYILSQNSEHPFTFQLIEEGESWKANWLPIQ